MTNIAELGIAVDSGDAVQAATDLDKLVDAGKSAEGSAQRVGAAWESALGSLNSNTQQIVRELQSLNAKQDTTAQLMATVGRTLADVSQGFSKTASAANDLVVAETKVSATADDSSARLLEMAKASLEASQYHQSLTTSMGASAAAIDGAKKATTDWAAVQAEANARGQAILETEARLAAETKKAAAATGVQADGLQALLGKINPTVAALQKLDDQQEQLNQHRKAGNIDADTFKEYSADIEAARAKLKGFNDTSAESKTGLSSLALNSKEARENVLQLGNALAEGNFRVAAHNILEIATNAGSSALALASVVAPIALVVGGLAGLAVAYAKGSEESSAFNKALILTGNYAGTSADALSIMAKQVSVTVGTTGAAADVLAKLAVNGNIASASFSEITTAALEMQEATGKSVDSTIAEFAKIAEDPVAAAKSLNDQYHFLTASTYSQIVALEKQNDTTGAAKILTDAYSAAVQSRSKEILENLGTVEKAWNAVKNAASKAIDATLDVGRTQSIDAQIANYQKILDDRKTSLTAKVFSGTLGPDSDSTKFIEAQIDALKRSKAALEASSKAQSNYDEAQSKSQEAQRQIDALISSSLSPMEKRNKLLADYARWVKDIKAANPRDARVTDSAVAAGIADIKEKNKDPAPKSAGAVDLTAFNDSKNALAGILSDYQNSQKQLDAAQKAGLISQASYSTQRSALIEAEKEQVSAAYEAEISALEAAKNKSTTTAAQRIELDQKIADARASMVKAQKDADSQLDVLATAEKGRLEKQTYAIDQYVSALSQQQKALALAGQRAVLAVGQGDSQAGLNSQLNAQDDRYAQQRLELENQRSDPSRNMSKEEFEQKSDALVTANKKATDQIKQNYADLQDAQGDWTKGATSAWENYLDSAKDIAGQTKSLFTNAFSSMEDAIVNFATTGKLSFSDFAKSVIADMARIAARQASTGILSSVLGLASSSASSLFGAGSTASAGSTQAGYSGVDLSGYRATGGGVSPNSLYQVNELGPELYSQGGKSYLMTGANGGSVTPLTSGASASMASSGGSSPVSVSISIASDGTTDVASNQAGLSSFGTEIGSLVEQKYKQLEAKSLSPQGNIRKAINGRA